MNRTPRTWIAFALAAVAGVSIVWAQRAPAPQPVHAAASFTLRYAHAVGQRARVTTRVRTHAPDPVGDATVNTTHTFATTAVNADGSAERTATLDAFTMQGFGVSTELRALVQRHAVGAALSLTLSACGDITARAAVRPPADEVKPVIDGVLQSLDDVFVPLPESPVAVGGSWTVSREAPYDAAPGMHITLSIESTYTLVEKRDTNIKVSESAVITVPAGSNVSGLPIEATGRVTGQYDVDLAHAVTMHGHVSSQLAVSFAIHDRPQRLETRFETDIDGGAL